MLPPLPNHLFTRDGSVRVGDLVVVCPMRWPARHAEALNIEALYRFHPRFAGVEVWRPEPDPAEAGPGPAALEGGDVMVLGARTVVVGMGERTTAPMVEVLARRLFETKAADRVVVVELPRARATMHLDTVLTVVDRDAVCVFPRALHVARTHSLRPGRTRSTLAVEPERGVLEAVASGDGRGAAATCGWSRPGATPTSGPGSSGAAPTTPSPSRPASW